MSDEKPYEDPFNDQVKHDPFEDDHFTNRQQSNSSNYSGGQIPVPNASAVLALGIMSLVGSFCYGVVGLIFAIMALAIAAAPSRQYRSNPDMFTASSYSTLKAGKICGLIGLILSIVILLFFAVAILFIASDGRDPFRYSF